MKKLISFSLSMLLVFNIYSQSSTIAPNYVVIPGVASLPTCLNADKGKTVFNTTDNKMYFCDGSAWQSMAGVPSAGVGWAQNGANIYNTNAGNVGIGTNAPSLPLTVKGPTVSGEIVNVQNSTGTVNLVTKLVDIGTSSVAQIRTNTLSDVWISASKSFPDVQIQTNGNVNIANYTTGKVGIGTTTADEKLHVGGNLKVNGDIKTNEGIYSATTGSLNLVPLGVCNVAFGIDEDGSLWNYYPVQLENLAGNVLSGAYNYSYTISANDQSYFTFYLNQAVLAPYSKFVVIGTPQTNTFEWTNIFVDYNAYNNVTNPCGVLINLRMDDAHQCKVRGTFIIYGIK